MDAELPRAVKDYWDGRAPYSAAFDEAQASKLLLDEVNRYEAALLQMAKPRRGGSSGTLSAARRRIRLRAGRPGPPCASDIPEE